MKPVYLIALLCLCTVLGIAQAPVPQLPQVYIDTTFTPPTGATWQPHNSSSFQSALNSASPGDTIILDAGVTYQGNFTFPSKSNPNNQWIYIVGSAMSSLPAPGTRVNPATDAALMPKIVTSSVTAAITIAAGGNHYRLVGLEVYTASTYGCNSTSSPPVNCFSYQLIYAASQPNKPLVDSITVDRCYVHGSPTKDVRQGIQVNGSNFAVVDSYISEIHQSTSDSQAILGYYTPGPIKIVNNYLSATTENIMFGGAGGLTNPWVPSDIEIRNNYIYKPMSWAQAGVTLPPANMWVVKNHVELKSARRLLLDHNIMENVWVSGQTGFSIMLTPRTHESGLSAVVDDITIQNNTLKNVSSGFDTLEYDSACLPANGCTNPGEMKRVAFYNNLFLLGDTTQPGYSGGYDWGGLVVHDLVDFVLQHNTVVAPPNLASCKASWYFETSGTGAATPPSSRTHNVWILDNALCRQLYGPIGFVGQFSYSLTDYMGDPSPADSRLKGNVLYAPTADKVYAMPAHNYVSNVPFTYVNPGLNNFQLLSPYWTDTSDGYLAGVATAALP